MFFFLFVRVWVSCFVSYRFLFFYFEFHFLHYLGGVVKILFDQFGFWTDSTKLFIVSFHDFFEIS